MKKRLFKTALVAAATTMVLGACSSGSSENKQTESGDSTALTAWAWDPNFNIKALQVAEEEYNQFASEKITLDIVENAQDDIIQKLNTSLSSGVSNGLPNIVLIEDYRAKSFLDAYPNSFFPLTDFIDTDEFTAYKIAATSIDGVPYAIPFDSGVTGLYVRKDLLEESGHSVEDMTDITWSELETIGQDIYDKTQTKLLSTDLNSGALIRGMMQSSGSWYTKEDGTTPYIQDNQALQEAFKTIKSLREADLVNIHNNWSEMLQAFNTGKVATVPSGNWITPSIMAEESQSGKWVVVPWPRQNLEQSVNASNLGGASLYVINVEGKEAAAAFLSKTFGTNKDFYKTLLTEVGAVGTYLPVKDTDAYDQEVAYFGGQKIYEDFANWSEDIPAVNYGKNTYAFEDIVVNALQDYLKGAELSDVLKNAQQQAESQVK